MPRQRNRWFSKSKVHGDRSRALHGGFSRVATPRGLVGDLADAPSVPDAGPTCKRSLRATHKSFGLRTELPAVQGIQAGRSNAGQSDFPTSTRAQPEAAEDLSRSDAMSEALGFSLVKVEFPFAWRADAR